MFHHFGHRNRKLPRVDRVRHAIVNFTVEDFPEFVRAADAWGQANEPGVSPWRERHVGVGQVGLNVLVNALDVFAAERFGVVLLNTAREDIRYSNCPGAVIAGLSPAIDAAGGPCR